ncbi:TolC family protein [Fulvivirgaceae bacterium BMA10]|uniref:TolC family protein n=1 Tax=Splendidivirga corallicola TaxID=3051826 RepID=A0ABT8KXA0_9BACT|nr:TolC family protein [Fulvivirgaceae bacterium BMA10]
MSIRKKLIICLLHLGIIAHGQSLEDYIQEGLANNPGLKSKHQEYLAALETIDQSGALPDPQLAAGYFISPVETRVGPQRARFSFTQKLPWFGTLTQKKSVSSEMAQALLAAYELEKKSFVLALTSQWYTLYELDRNIVLAQQNLDLLKSFERLALTKYESGKSSLVDVIRVQLQFEAAEEKLAALRDQRMLQQSDLNLLIDKPKGSEVKLPDTLNSSFQITFDSVELLADHPSIDVIDHKLNQWTAQQQVAELSNKPSFGVGMDYAIVGNRENIDIVDNGKDIFMPMVSLSLPIFSKKNKGKVNEVIIQRDATKNLRAQKINDLTLFHEQALQEYKDGSRKINVYQSIINKSEQALRILISSYSASDQDFEDVLKMQQSIIENKMALEAAIKKMKIAHAKFEYLKN